MSPTVDGPVFASTRSPFVAASRRECQGCVLATPPWRVGQRLLDRFPPPRNISSFMASSLLRRQFALSKRSAFRSFSSTSARWRPEQIQPGGRNVFDTHTVEDLHGMSASDILAESGTRADSKLRHFTGTYAMILWYQTVLFITLKKSTLGESTSMGRTYQVMRV